MRYTFTFYAYCGIIPGWLMILTASVILSLCGMYQYLGYIYSIFMTLIVGLIFIAYGSSWEVRNKFVYSAISIIYSIISGIAVFALVQPAVNFAKEKEAEAYEEFRKVGEGIGLWAKAFLPINTFVIIIFPCICIIALAALLAIKGSGNGKGSIIKTILIWLGIITTSVIILIYVYSSLKDSEFAQTIVYL